MTPENHTHAKQQPGAVKGLLFCALLTMFVFGFAGSAEAQAACYTWTCNTSTGQCSFNANCSDDTPLNYQWNFGDGATAYEFDPYVTHTFASPISSSSVELSVGYLFIGYYDVTCNIQIRNVISPTYPTFSGTCS